MAKGKKKKLSKAEQALQHKREERNRKARERRAAIKAAEEAARKKRQISSRIAYRNARLRKNITINQEDQKDRDRYLKELRALYKEQNPKKNKKLTKKELEHIKNFRDFAQSELDNLRNKPESYFENLTNAQKKEHVKKVKYFERTAKKYGKIVDKSKGIKLIKRTEDVEETGEDELLDSKENILLYQLVEAISDDARDPFYKKIEFYFKDELFRSIVFNQDNRQTITLDVQAYASYVENNYIGSYAYYNINYFYSGKIVVFTTLDNLVKKR